MAKETRDQKRKKKLKERERKSSQTVSLAYTGRKYKTKSLASTWLATETAIHQARLMAGPRIVDRTVKSALERLIRQMRSGILPPPPDGPPRYTRGEEEDFLIECIRGNWETHFDDHGPRSKDDLIGVLRSILGTMEEVKDPGAQSRGYLQYIAKFLTKKMGISYMVSDVQESDDEAEKDEKGEEEDVDELLSLRRDWIEDGDIEARSEFFELAGDLMRNGDSRRVVETCDELLAERSRMSPDEVADIVVLKLDAQRAQLTRIA